MPRRIPQDPNYRTACPAAVKAKITALEDAVADYAFTGSQPLAERAQILSDAQFRRYCLEQTILTAIEDARADAERKAREANQARRAQVCEEMEVVFETEGLDSESARKAAAAIMAGRIPHVKVEM